MEWYGDYEDSWQPRKDLDEDFISLYFDAHAQRKRDVRTAIQQAHSTQAARGRAAADKGGLEVARRFFCRINTANHEGYDNNGTQLSVLGLRGTRRTSA